jgi:RNA polymerase sigma-70 factor (ECF subfamily)
VRVTQGDERSDAALLQRHVEGDPDAFSELVLRHQDRLWAVAVRTTGDPEDASDALQEALVSAFRRAGTFRGDAQVTTWLHRIVVNACLDRIRRRKAKATDPLPDDQDHRTELADRRATDDPDEVSERRADVLAALRQLNADQRAALVLVDMEGYSVDEAAEILGCAPGTVKSRCARGRVRLVPLLTSYRRNQETSGGVEPATPAVARRAAPASGPSTRPGRPAT